MSNLPPTIEVTEYVAIASYSYSTVPRQNHTSREEKIKAHRMPRNVVVASSPAHRVRLWPVTTCHPRRWSEHQEKRELNQHLIYISTHQCRHHAMNCFTPSAPEPRPASVYSGCAGLYPANTQHKVCDISLGTLSFPSWPTNPVPWFPATW